MNNNFYGIDAIKFATVHRPVPTSDTEDLTEAFRFLECVTAGTAVIVDQTGYALSRTYEVGDTVLLSPKRINATGTTAAFVGYR
jgi:hypothetical protein